MIWLKGKEIVSNVQPCIHYADTDYPRVGDFVSGIRIVRWPEKAIGGQGRVAFAKDAKGRKLALKFEDAEHGYWKYYKEVKELFLEQWQEDSCGLRKDKSEIVFKKLCSPLLFGPCSDRWNIVKMRREAFEHEIKILDENRSSRNPTKGLPILLGKGAYRWRDCHGQTHCRQYFVMEQLENLGELPKEEDGIAALMLDICTILKELHRKKIFHQDIKEENLMRRGETGELVLIDFGISAESAGGRGTQGYSAPEVLAGEKATPAADIYSLGVLISQCFRDNIPVSWLKIISMCVRLSAKDRYRQIDDLARAIRCRNSNV